MENKMISKYKKIALIGLIILGLAGCATSTRYVNYTNQRFLPKDQYFKVDVYPVSHPLGSAKPYYVIGKISIDGYASFGVTPERLTIQAREIARKRGADAIINADTQVFRYYGDALLRFRGELIVYVSEAPK
jgi:hypothetical protein